MNSDAPASQIAGPRRILVRGVNWLGDAVMTTPALQRLRQRFPESAILLLTHQKLAELWQRHPSIDRVLTFARGESPFAISQRLRGETCDTALVLPNSPRSALEVWLAGIPRRIGFARRWRNWFLTNAVRPPAGAVAMRKRSAAEARRLVAISAGRAPGAGLPGYPASAHHLHQYLQLTAAMGANPAPLAPLLRVGPDEVAAARSAWLTVGRPSANGSASAVCVGLNPSAAYGDAKRWPIENFVAVAREVSRRVPGVLWLVFGEANDQSLCDRVAAAGVRSRNLAGKTSLRELMALLSECRVLLTNDSGPMHVAAALGTPVVVPFGSTSPWLTGPGLPGDPRHRVLTSSAPCAPCFRRTCPIDFRCMTGITAERVSAAVLEAIDQGTRS